jgi:hypothetical protein
MSTTAMGWIAGGFWLTGLGVLAATRIGSEMKDRQRRISRAMVTQLREKYDALTPTKFAMSPEDRELFEELGEQIELLEGIAEDKEPKLRH